MWKKEFDEKMRTIEEVAATIQSGDTIFAGGSTDIPYSVLDAVSDRYEELNGVKVVGCLSLRPPKFFTDVKYKNHIEYYSFFYGGADKIARKNNVGHICSVHFSRLFEYLLKRIPSNVVMAEVSEPDEDGYLYWGPTGAAWVGVVAEKAETVIGVVNKHRTRIHGEKHRMHISQFKYLCRDDHPLQEFVQAPISEEDQKICDYVLPQIPDGATLQIGLGGVANAVGFGLKQKKNLSVYSEMFTDSLLDLVECGSITGTIDVGFALGSERNYAFTEGDRINMLPISVTNDPYEVAKRDNFISINSCLMADLTGQVCSESIGYNQFSGTGGQLDFVRGAALSKGGKSFLCMHSTAKDKQGNVISRINFAMPEGAIITVPRTDVMYIVTEYGIADLWCRSIEERIEQMISIAHPDFREELRAKAVAAGMLLE